jgi:hypothetical protein
MLAIVLGLCGLAMLAIAMRFSISRQKLGFRAKSLILGLVTVCVVVGWKAVDRAIRQSTAVSRVSRTGGTPQYRFLVPVPQWCVDRFGPDLFARVTSVSYFEWGAFPPRKPENYRNYAALSDLPYIEEIDVFDSPFPIDVLGNLTTLQRLAIVQNGLRDDDIHEIAKLHSLRTLSLTSNDITDSGAQNLSRLHNLTELDLSGNVVSDKAISELQRSLPNCRIKNDWGRADGPK